jgi:hypothetical protein
VKEIISALIGSVFAGKTPASTRNYRNNKQSLPQTGRFLRFGTCGTTRIDLNLSYAQVYKQL